MLSDIIQTLHDGKMLSNKYLKLLVEKAIINDDDTELRQYLESYPVILKLAQRNIQLEQYQKLKNSFLFPTQAEAEEHLDGPVKLGYVNPNSSMFAIHPDIFCLPAMCLGRPGSGKSWLIKYIIIQLLILLGFNIIIPDLKKEYRDIDGLKIINKDHIALALLRPPESFEPLPYASFFSKVFTRENYLVGTSENVLFEIVVGLYRKRGILDGGINYPTVWDLYRVIQYCMESTKTFRYKEIYQWLLNRLQPYILYDYFDHSHGIPDDIWRNENIVLEMDTGFTDRMYSFITAWLLGGRYNYNKHHRLAGSRLRTLFIVDEGRILFDPNRDTSTFGYSYIDETITKIREYGIGLIVSSQESASFSQTIRSLSYLKICFPLTDGKDIEFIKESFGLDDDQAAYLFKLPRYGQAIVRYGGYEKPFLLAVPRFQLNKALTDEEVAVRMSDFWGKIDSSIKEKEAAAQQAVKTVQEEKKPDMPPSASALLYFLGKNPFTNKSDLKKDALSSPDEVDKALRWLEDKGFVNIEKHRISQKGRKSHFAVLTGKALDYLDIKPIPGKGSFEHKLYQHLIATSLLKVKRGKARIETQIPYSDKSVDILLVTGEDYWAYEVTLHFNNLQSNIQKDIEAGAARVIAVVRDKKGIKKAEAIITGDIVLHQHREIISVEPISNYFNK
jgi:hypothetical protein